MAISVTERAELSSTTDGSSYATGSYTPLANKGLIAVVYASGTAAADATFTGNGLTWTLESSLISGFGQRLYVFSALTGASPSAGAGTFTCTSDPATGANIHVAEVDVVSLSDFTTQVMLATVANGATPAATFSAATIGSCAILAYAGINLNPAGLTPPTGYTELMDAGYGTPAIGLEMAYHVSPGSVSTVTWGSAAGAAGVVALVEIKANRLVAVGQALETDTGTAMAKTKVKAIAQALETDTGTVTAHYKSRVLGQALETDTGTVVAKKKIKAIGQALSTHTAQPITRVHSKVLGQATEIDTGQFVSPRLAPTDRYGVVVLADSPLGFWRLDEAHGTVAKDDSGNGHDGTYVNSPGLSQTSLLTTGTRKSIRIGAGNASVDLNVSPSSLGLASSSGFAMEYWFDHDPGETAGFVLAVREPGTDDVLGVYGSNDDLGDDNFAATWGTVGVDSIFGGGLGHAAHHVIFQGNASGGWTQLWVDGRLVATGVFDPTPPSSTRHFQVGPTLGAPYNGPVIAVGLVDEVAIYDHALSAARVKQHYYVGSGMVEVLPVEETDTAQSVTEQTATIVAVAQALETDTGTAMTRKKAKAVAQALETDTATSITRKKQKAISQALETDTSQAIARTKVKAIAQTTETDTATSIIRKKQKAVAQASETDTATAMTRRKTRTLGQSVETDTGQPVGKTKIKAFAQALETDTAQAITRRKLKVIGQALESDIAQALFHAKIKLIGQATETDTATIISRLKRKAISQAVELDTAQPIARRKIKAILQAVEQDLSQPVGRLKTRVIGLVLETDTASPVAKLKLVHVGQALETDTAAAIDSLLSGAVLVYLVGSSISEVALIGVSDSFAYLAGNSENEVSL